MNFQKQQLPSMAKSEKSIDFQGFEKFWASGGIFRYSRLVA
jgi:hypothetical protein